MKRLVRSTFVWWGRGCATTAGRRRVFQIAGLLVLVMLGVVLPYDLIALAQGDRRSLSVGGHWPSPNAIGPLPAGARSGAGFTLADRGQIDRPSPELPSQAHGQDLRTPTHPATLNGSIIRVQRHAGVGVPRTTSMLVGAPTVDANGVKSFPVTSVFQGPKPTTVRVLEPTSPAPGKPRRILYVLPVESGVTTLSSKYSDGLEELRLLGVPNRYNITLIAPSFHIQPWYGDHHSKIERRLESFIVKDLVPFGDRFESPKKIPQRWVIGFSKSGTGALSLILRHQNVFSAMAAWDAPAQLTDMAPFPGMVENFGTEENFNSYEIPALVTANAQAFRARTRIWISGDDSAWTPHMARLDDQMTRAGVLHTFVRSGSRRHHWASGWLEAAVAWLDANAVSDAPGGKRTPTGSSLPGRESRPAAAAHP
jgi:S-formylglutathione hydrolase FrmB